MAIGQSVQQLGPIDPSSLIGRADRTLVEPKATAALIDSFRQGVITADDIVNRIGQLGQSKKKAEIDIAGMQSMQAQEAMSPEAQATREAQLQATTATAQQTAERARFPATKAFDDLAPGAGVEVPTLPDGITPDSRKKEKLGSRLAAWKALRDDAREDLKNVKTDLDPVTGITKVLLEGKPLTNEQHRALQKQAQMSFQSFDSALSGTDSSVDSPVAAPVSAARPSVAVSPSVDTGTGYQLRQPLAEKTPVVDPVERAQALAVTEALLPQIAEARAAVTRGGGVGPVEGSALGRARNTLGSWFGQRTSELKDQRDLTILVSQKILEGAQGMKGNLSDRDVQFLKDIVPKLSDQEATWNTFFDRWEAMTKVNRDILSGKITKPTGDLFAPADYNPAAKAAVAAAAAATATIPRFNSPAEVPATTQFVIGPDGNRYKNPNYKP